MNLLILGGTNDALRLAENLHQKGVTVIYSLVGLARIPIVDYQVVIGGFSQYEGLENYIRKYAIAGILDATHPYANTISETAYDAALANNIPYWQFDRPAWKERAEDNWFEYNNWNELWSMLENKKSLFITTGQLDQITLDKLVKKLAAKVLLRTAIKPTANLDKKICWIQAIGPFSLDDEKALMQEHSIDALISKNSGGEATVAKLEAAKQLQVPVYLLKRPKFKGLQGDQSEFQGRFLSIETCETAVLEHFR